MFEVTTEWRQQRAANGRTSQKLLSRATEESEWPDGVAEFIAGFLEEHPKIGFSGMEDFGQGGCLMHPVSLRCQAYGDCRHHHIESVREWVEKRVDAMKTGEVVDFTGGALKWVSIEVKAIPEPEPEDEPEDESEPEPEPEDEPEPESEPESEPEDEEMRSPFTVFAINYDWEWQIAGVVRMAIPEDAHVSPTPGPIADGDQVARYADTFWADSPEAAVEQALSHWAPGVDCEGCDHCTPPKPNSAG
ncbi:hypothetical protein [Streptomyces sp. NPDC088775]|uniref:hypothetical protein n=1 Tax=Streptomyces sp. NPDC088775 TaxID=3365896 RepID=UPI00380478D7